MSEISGASKRARWIVGGAIAGLVCAVGLAWFVVTSIHGAPVAGSYSVAMSNAMLFADDQDTRENERFLIFGREGDTAVVTYAVRNDGPLPLALVGTGQVSGKSVSKLEWSPAIVEGKKADLTLHGLPVTVEPGHEITLWVSVTKPACEKGQDLSLQTIDVRWSVLGRVRGSELALVPGRTKRPIALCDPDIEAGLPQMAGGSDFCELFGDLLREEQIPSTDTATADPGRSEPGTSCR